MLSCFYLLISDRICSCSEACLKICDSYPVLFHILMNLGWYVSAVGNIKSAILAPYSCDIVKRVITLTDIT